MNRPAASIPTAEVPVDTEAAPFLGTSEDLKYGQIVIVTARWILIASALVIALWAPGPVDQLRVEIATALLLAGLNFYLHSQLLIRRPVLDSMVYAASVGDLVVITAIVGAQGGFSSGDYIFYYPAVLAFAVSFPRVLTLAFASAAAFMYGAIALATMSEAGDDATAVFLRLLTLAAVAVCGMLYWGVERRRRERSRTLEGTAAS